MQTPHSLLIKDSLQTLASKQAYEDCVLIGPWVRHYPKTYI